MKYYLKGVCPSGVLLDELWLMCRFKLIAAFTVNGRKKGLIMLNWALTFLIVALAAAVLGFGGIAGEAAWIAKVLFVVFLVMFLISALTGRRAPLS